MRIGSENGLRSENEGNAACRPRPVVSPPCSFVFVFTFPHLHLSRTSPCLPRRQENGTERSTEGGRLRSPAGSKSFRREPLSRAFHSRKFPFGRRNSSSPRCDGRPYRSVRLNLTRFRFLPKRDRKSPVFRHLESSTALGYFAPLCNRGVLLRYRPR